jgi:hypothetical protein
MVGSGVGGPGGIELRKAINGKFTNNPCWLRNCLNLSHVDRVMRRIQSSGHHYSLSFILLCGDLIIQQISALVPAVR